MKTEFAHLHTHSHYSLLEALPQISDLVAAAAKDRQRALALTDNGNMYAAIEFYKTCKENAVKPIIGVDFFVAPRTRHDKEHRVDDSPSRLVLLAKNFEGYSNLMQLVTKSHLDGFFYRPRIDKELIEMHSGGLLAILPSHGGEQAYSLRHVQKDRARRVVSYFRDIYKDDCYIEITSHAEIEGHDEIMRAQVELAKDIGIPTVAAQDIYYMSREDALACDLVNKIRTGGVLNRGGEEYVMKDFSFRTQATMEDLFKEFPEALGNVEQVAEKCNLTIPLGKWVFPDFQIPEGSSHDEELRKLSYQGIPARGFSETPEIIKRIDYELSIIAQKGYSSYFLVMADLLREARKRGIFTNTRGSAAGSLVSYLCGITTVDPIAFNMPFERFLNPARPSPPDIDLDLADNRRDELLDYIREKYGDTHVAQIGTFGTMMARAAVRDVARALGHPYGVGDRIAKMIPFGKQGFPVYIDSSLKNVPELAAAYEKDAEAREVLDLARKIEGNARHVGVHAAGVFITPQPITEYVPIQLDPKGGKIITQYDMYAAGEDGLGLLKFDLLGLTNLSVLADSVDRVRARLNKEVDLEKIPLDDKRVYEMLSRGETLGVFQFSGSGMTNYLSDLKPTAIHDLNAMVALYRPGPMAFIPLYIERKHNPKLVKYLDPRLETILKDSYGILIYQDDLLLIASELAGYSMGEADKFRRAVGKKIPAEMAAQKERFVKGCIERGMKKETAQKLWEQIETFAAYGFNKAHAASYGNLAYKTAYMKANFPVDYMAAVLTADAGDVEKISEVVAECKRMGIKILPPSINESFGTFTVVDNRTESRSGAPDARRGESGERGVSMNTASEMRGTRNEADGISMRDYAIRFGLYSIKNFGSGVADSIIAARESGGPSTGADHGSVGPFSDIGNFLSRIPDKNLNKKSLEALIKSGALDDIAERGSLLEQLDTLLEFHREHTNVSKDQASLFGASLPINSKFHLGPGSPAKMEERLLWEKELLGLYVSGHPLDKYKEKLAKQKLPIREAREKFARGVETVIAGMLENIRPILTKTGERMLFGRIADYSGGVEIVAFPRVLKENDSLFQNGSCLAAKGKFTNRNGEASFIIERVKAL